MAPKTARIDVAAVRAAAEHFDASARALDTAIHTHLSRLRFGGAVAGRAHAARGDALRAALDQVAQALGQWSRASAEIAASLHATAARYDDADSRTAARYG